jgi:hypothetical protein
MNVLLRQKEVKSLPIPKADQRNNLLHGLRPDGLVEGQEVGRERITSTKSVALFLVPWDLDLSQVVLRDPPHEAQYFGRHGLRGREYSNIYMTISV